jgi:hypothetical protein
MLVRLQRLQAYNNYTLGALYIDNLLMCFVLEDEPREVKVKGKTRIPAGIYPMKLRNVGSVHNWLNKAFSFHIGSLHITDVPGFQYILIHPGNSDADTAGCLLPGYQHVINNNFIGQSTKAYTSIYPIIANRIKDYDDVKIHIIDELHG